MLAVIPWWMPNGGRRDPRGKGRGEDLSTLPKQDRLCSKSLSRFVPFPFWSDRMIRRTTQRQTRPIFAVRFRGLPPKRRSAKAIQLSCLSPL